MSASTLESTAAFKERAKQIGVEDRYIDKFVAKNFAAFGRYAFAVVYSPQHTDETPLLKFLNDLLDEQPSPDQLSCMRRLFFESYSMALTDVRQRVEGAPDPSAVTRKLATAEMVARQQEQQARLGGIVFIPETTPSTSCPWIGGNTSGASLRHEQPCTGTANTTGYAPSWGARATSTQISGVSFGAAKSCAAPSVLFFRPTPDGSRQVVYQAGKTIAFCKFTELMQ